MSESRPASGASWVPTGEFVTRSNAPDPSCVRGRRLVCDDDLCHGVDQTICGLWSGHDFAGPLDDNDYDEDGSWLPL